MVFKPIYREKCVYAIFVRKRHHHVLTVNYQIILIRLWNKGRYLVFPRGPTVNNPPANAGDMGSVPDLGRFHMPLGN